MITNYSVTFRFGCVQNVGDYSNVRPELEVSLTGQGDGPEANAVAKRLLHDVRQEIQEIVDEELEIRHQDHLYYDGETFSLLEAKDFHFIAIVSDEHPLPELWKPCLKYGLKHKRLEALQRRMKMRYEGDTAFLDVPILSVDALPELEEFTFLMIDGCEPHYLILLSGDRRYLSRGKDNCPTPPVLVEYYERAVRQQGFLRVMDRERFMRDMLMKSEDEGWTLINCLDNKYSALPPLPPLSKPEPIQEDDDIPFDDDDDEEYDEYEDEDEDEDA